ncbi:VCBS repeat-containing protein [Flavitalea sp. BT771]|uniref:VCBS repeat-containing protein n=1 Tax=Flavitalea sp. BT771 TaxID=3063329 RepID=UPI0026E1AF10|nr:VCBS repeat-containing protein [Flavitalea sp. BT771]MDO6432528.1 VCBS repeat-containing protein [Flavitalea sp. BT771]MDV6221437.1 VCBS repeat-containing protein [Flavitalea sp. BT771]
MDKTPVMAALCLLTALASCVSHDRKEGLHFTRLSSSSTGVTFSNTITEDDSANMFVNEYTYMGGGVGIGDFNKDGLPDIFFTGSQVSSRLYLNKGKMRFEDITAAAGVTTAGWCTGVSIIDINNDGWPDIYVCVSGKVPGGLRKNLLFVNQHDLRFSEEAAAYGLADTGYATQAVFFDYDKDGRPDMYLLNHTLNDDRPNDIRDRKTDSNAIAGDKLFHNDGIPAGMDHPVFRDVSKLAGIVEDGNGLGVAVSDINGDGYPDIYVANDYIRNDRLWLNNKDGTFTNCISAAMRHQSYSSMGVDAADLNNDELPDIMSLDMQPETSRRKKMMYSFLGEERCHIEAAKGYEPQYIRNMLQLNNGNRLVNHREEPFFSEIGQLAGVFETDWSWSVLLADLDNDGWKDIHITNGLGRDPTNIDFLEYRRNMMMRSGVPEKDAGQRRMLMEHLSELGPVRLHNYLYRNNGSLSFEDISIQAGIDEPSVSNGAAYADLDNDGDLDLVTNNINSTAFIMRNDLAPAPAASNNLTVVLKGDSLNRDGLGTKIFAYAGTSSQMVEQYPVRGYLSSVDARPHFGFGARQVDSLRIVWPDGRTEFIDHPAVNKTLLVTHADAQAPPPGNASPSSNTTFKDLTQQMKIDFVHKESFFYDYGIQPLIQQKYSQEGPFISTGDINGDGLEDFFIAGAFRQSGRVFLQKPGGDFTGRDLVTGVKNEEDMQSALFDADGDGDLDLLIAGGSSEFEINSSFYRPRLYLNDGKGNFRQDESAFSPMVRTPAKSIAVADMDGDGDQDVFIGGRVSLGTFPTPPRSYVLRNDHGKFVDVTAAVCPALETPGLINAAVWADLDHDNSPELLLAGDWMSLRIFKNNGGTLVEITAQSGLAEHSGFWRSLAVADIDHDGDMDIIAGNFGLNNPFHINDQQPAQLIARDFDANGIVEPIFCNYIKNDDGKFLLSAGIPRDQWARQMPSIKKSFDVNASYAAASMDQLFTKEMMAGATVLHCAEVRSGFFENDGHGKFTFHPFPTPAQIAPVNAIVVDDVDKDGRMDILLAGNEYQAAVPAGRYDASYGLWLKGDGHGGFIPVPPATSGLILDGDVKDLKMIKVAGRRIMLAAINDQPMKAFCY